MVNMLELPVALRQKNETIGFPAGENAVIAVVSDTHGRPHPALFPTLEQHHPSLILHAGDVGDLQVIQALERVCQTLFVRGNVDPVGPAWPDAVALRIQVGLSEIRLLTLHAAMARLKLTRDTWTLLRRSPAQVVLFGHSHVPFLGMDGKIYLFNPGSAGPARWGLPVTFGLIDISTRGMRFRHLDLQTGQTWIPEGKRLG